MGIAATVSPNSVEFDARTRMINCHELARRAIDMSSSAYLHGDASKEEEIKLQEANHDLVPLIHGCVNLENESRSSFANLLTFRRRVCSDEFENGPSER